MFHLVANENILKSLNTVDGSRKIIEKASDIEAVSKLSDELNLLVLRIARELQPDVETSYAAWRAKVENTVLL